MPQHWHIQATPVTRGRTKAEIPLSAETESDVSHSAETYVPPKVQWDFWPKTETESLLCLGRRRHHTTIEARKSRPASVHLISFNLTPPCSVSLITRRTVPDADADIAATSSVILTQYTVRLMTPHVQLTQASAVQALCHL